jgi:hypothetical protein
MTINFHYLGCSCDVVQSRDSLIDLGWSLIKMPLGWVTIWLGNGPFTRVSDPPINHAYSYIVQNITPFQPFESGLIDHVIAPIGIPALLINKLSR